MRAITRLFVLFFILITTNAYCYMNYGDYLTLIGGNSLFRNDETRNRIYIILNHDYYRDQWTDLKKFSNDLSKSEDSQFEQLGKLFSSSIWMIDTYGDKKEPNPYEVGYNPSELAIFKSHFRAEKQYLEAIRDFKLNLGFDERRKTRYGIVKNINDAINEFDRRRIVYNEPHQDDENFNKKFCLQLKDFFGMKDLYGNYFMGQIPGLTGGQRAKHFLSYNNHTSYIQKIPPFVSAVLNEEVPSPLLVNLNLETLKSNFKVFNQHLIGQVRYSPYIYNTIHNWKTKVAVQFTNLIRPNRISQIPIPVIFISDVPPTTINSYTDAALAVKLVTDIDKHIRLILKEYIPEEYY